MKIFDSDQWEEIFDSLTRNKARTFLTAFGIFWGIFMLVLLMGGGNGLKTMLGSNFAGFASNSGFVISNATTKPYKGFSKGRMWRIKQKDCERLKSCVPELDVVTPTIRSWSSTAKFNNKSLGVGLVGVYTDYFIVDNPKIKYGRCLNDVDIQQRRKVCVVGSRVVEELFPGIDNPCGQFINIDETFYQIVGVGNKSANGISIGSNPTRTVHLPYTTMQLMYNKGDNVDFLCFTAKGSNKMSDVQTKVEKVLKRTHLIHPEDNDAMMKINTEAIFKLIDNLFNGISVLIWMIGLGTLLAGAIGVSNIMIVTVKERTTEIGIRRAIGATPKDIIGMIMSESIVLTLSAGMSGIVFAVLILQAIESSVQEPGLESHFQISFSLALGSALLLAILGIVAGLAPAMRAMEIKPVDAMREE